MTQHPWFLDRAFAVVQPLNARFMPRVQPLLDSAGADFGRLAHLQTAQSAEPGPLTLELMAARAPYMSRARIADGEAAEADTDARYFAPWDLTSDEATEIEGLLEEVATALAAEVEAAPAAV